VTQSLEVVLVNSLRPGILSLNILQTDSSKSLSDWPRLVKSVLSFSLDVLLPYLEVQKGVFLVDNDLLAVLR
jgi:hypothetical protein